jgi:hypothetical protein
MATTINSVARDYHLGYDTVYKLVTEAGIAPAMTIRQGARNVAVYNDDIANLAAQYVAKIAAERAAKRNKRNTAPAPVAATADPQADAWLWREAIERQLVELRAAVERIEASTTRVEKALDTLFAPAEPLNPQ